MDNLTPEEEFQELEEEIGDSDANVRGMAAVDFGSFGVEHPEFKDRIIPLLERCLNDPDEDVRASAQNSLEMLQGKEVYIETPGQIIAFGYLPEEYRQKEVSPKQSLMSCVCCIIAIILISVSLIFLF